MRYSISIKNKFQKFATKLLFSFSDTFDNEKQKKQEKLDDSQGHKNILFGVWKVAQDQESEHLEDFGGCQEDGDHASLRGDVLDWVFPGESHVNEEEEGENQLDQADEGNELVDKGPY